MKTLLALAILAIGASVAAFAAPAPEIDPASSASGLAFAAGAVLVIRARRAR
jgi:hypothetical protein